MLPRIVLVEPQGALNVGSVARVMMNFGFNELFLVNPRCDLHSEDAFKMATHAKEILQKAKIVESLETALKVAQESLRQLPNSGIEIGSWKICNCHFHGLFKLTPQMQSFLVLKTEVSVTRNWNGRKDGFGFQLERIKR